MAQQSGTKAPALVRVYGAPPSSEGYSIRHFLHRSDLRDVSPGQLVGLAAVALAFGICYWLMRPADERIAAWTAGLRG